MLNVLLAEFMKLRRSKVLILSLIVCPVPALIKLLQYSFKYQGEAATWEMFLSTGQELMVLCMLIVIILVSCFIFSMEYQYGTASYIFTSGTSKVRIFCAKLVSLLIVIAVMFVVSSLSQLCFGYPAIRSAIPGSLFLKLLKVTAWYIYAYFLLSAVIAMVVVITKRFVISAVIVFGYYMLVFPFHLKGNPYINPLMTPMVVAAGIFNSNDYIFTGYYRNIAINTTALAVFLTVLAIISLAVGISCYKRMDAVK